VTTINRKGLSLTPMTPLERLHFIRQLHHWSAALIDVGRYPFRRAEMFPPVVTASKLVSPPLVLWINRQSLQAGGVIFLSDTGSEPRDAARCARALGINYFIFWTPRNLTLWEQANEAHPPHAVWECPAPQPQQINDFQLLLTEVFDQFRQRLIPGAISDADLAPDYFATLCYHTLLSIRQPLREALRVARGANTSPPNLHPAHAAFSWSIAILLDALAHQIDEQRSAGAISVAELLAEQLSPCLDALTTGIALPDAVHTVIRQLEHRLRQLGWGTDRQRAVATIEQWIDRCSPLLNHRTSAWIEPLPLSEKRLFVNLPTAAPRDISIAPTPLHAATTLCRLLDSNDGACAQSLAWSGLTSESFTTVVASLPRQLFSPFNFRTTEGQAVLRKTWPSRRFSLTGQTPAWIYHGLALLAVPCNDGALFLELPEEWLIPPANAHFIELINRHYQLTELCLADHRRQRLKLCRTTVAGAVVVTGDHGPRHLPADAEQPLTASRLRLALSAADDLWEALAAGQLTPPLEKSDQRLTLAAETTLFRSSACGKFLAPFLDDAELMPLPPFDLLALFTGATNATDVEKAERELYRRLDMRPFDWDALRQPKDVSDGKRRLLRLPRTKILDELQLAAHAEGLPRFPHHYLYDYYKPALKRFTFSGPLEQQGEFFGCIQLQDPHGKRIDVDHLSTAVALQLASHLSEREVSLPEDIAILARIVRRYCNDLATLRSRLQDLAHRHLDNQRQANRLVAEVWAQLPLPPLKLLDKINTID